MQGYILIPVVQHLLDCTLISGDLNCYYIVTDRIYMLCKRNNRTYNKQKSPMIYLLLIFRIQIPLFNCLFLQWSCLLEREIKSILHIKILINQFWEFMAEKGSVKITLYQPLRWRNPLLGKLSQKIFAWARTSFYRVVMLNAEDWSLPIGVTVPARLPTILQPVTATRAGMWALCLLTV